MSQTTLDRCEILAGFTETPPALTRTFLSAPVRKVHAQVAEWMTSAGMTTRVDAIGNIIGRYAGDTADAPVLIIGSHLDTVPNGGKYDGILGVMIGIAVVEALGGKRLPFAIDVIGFSEEEGVRFATPYFGSRAAAGVFDPKHLQLKDRDGATVEQAIRDFGLDPLKIGDAAYDRKKVIGYVEAHIEQGPVLDALNLPVGVVVAIAGQSKYSVSFTGRAGHAGTVPMAVRRDALAAAAQFITAVESIARRQQNLVGTVGSLLVEPGAANVIPGHVKLSLDVRHHDDAVRTDAANAMLQMGQGFAKERGVRFNIDSQAHHSATLMDVHLSCVLADAVSPAPPVVHRLVSFAGHDAAIMAALCPVAMLFLRNPGGISHHPDESVSAADVAIAEQVLFQFVIALANQYHFPAA